MPTLFAGRRAALALCATALLNAPALHAQPGGERQLHLIVPFGPGGGSDVLARLLQPALERSLHATIVIDNRPGAGGSLGAALVAKSPPDGSVLLLADASVATIAPAFYPKLSYTARDLVPVTSLAQFANVLVAPTRLAADTLGQLAAQERAHPAPLLIASSGNGTSTHLAAELLKTLTKLPLTHVPYKGTGPAINDTIAGHVDLLFTGYATVAQLIQAGRLKAIAVTSPRRLPELPQVPTVRESGFADMDASISQAVFAPAGTPPEVVHRLSAAITAALRQPEVVARMKEQGLVPLGNSPEEFAAWVNAQSHQWARVIRDADLKPD